MSPYVFLYLLIPMLMSTLLWAAAPRAPVKLLGTALIAAVLPSLFVLPFLAEPGQDFDDLLLAVAFASLAGSVLAVAVGAMAGRMLALRFRRSCRRLSCFHFLKARSSPCPA